MHTLIDRVVQNFDVIRAQNGQLQIFLPVQPGDIYWLIFFDFSVVFNATNNKSSLFFNQWVTKIVKWLFQYKWIVLEHLSGLVIDLV
jgi:hypothetical protein